MCSASSGQRSAVSEVTRSPSNMKAEQEPLAAGSRWEVRGCLPGGKTPGVFEEKGNFEGAFLSMERTGLMEGKKGR